MPPQDGAEENVEPGSADTMRSKEPNVSHPPMNVRWHRIEGPPVLQPCSRCRAQGCPWDALAGTPVCPDCQQLMLLGEIPPMRLTPTPGVCAVCPRNRIVLFQTAPLRSNRTLEIDLCSEHLLALLGRRLSPRSMKRLNRQLEVLGLNCQRIFLLHESFYDPLGRALQPVPEVL